MQFILGALVGVAVAVAVIRFINGSNELQDDAAKPETEVFNADSKETELLEVIENLPIGVYLKRADGSVWMSDAFRDVVETKHGQVLVEEVVDRLLTGISVSESRAERISLVGPPPRHIMVVARGLPNEVGVAAIENVSEQVRLDSVRTDFVANISHELKTPIGAVSLLAETLADEDDLATVSRLAGKIVAETTRLSSTIDDLMELSRIELGGSAVKDPVSLRSVAEQALARVSGSAEQCGVSVVISGKQVVDVCGDVRQLVSATSNLLDNAIKYSDEGSHVEITLDSDATHGILCVVDHGVGIPANDQSRIFERFYRVDRARSRNTGGTGLGLAIVNHVVTNHGGTVSVKSVEGEGSTFCLMIPLISKISPTEEGT
ncbi:MAG: GHKL domain-containing protein [Actinobacteria bacterium]|nr:GHKL domain-containing protein [Actinomycetota bacterium]